MVSCVVWRWFAVPLACSLSSDVLSLGYFLLSCWMHFSLALRLAGVQTCLSCPHFSGQMIRHSRCHRLLLLYATPSFSAVPTASARSVATVCRAFVICHSSMFSRSICQLLICCRSICFGPICCHCVSCCCTAYTYSTYPLSLDGGLPSFYTMTLSLLLLRLLLRTLGCGISDCP